MKDSVKIRIIWISGALSYLGVKREEKNVSNNINLLTSESHVGVLPSIPFL